MSESKVLHTYVRINTAAGARLDVVFEAGVLDSQSGWLNAQGVLILDPDAYSRQDQPEPQLPARLFPRGSGHQAVSVVDRHDFEQPRLGPPKEGLTVADVLEDRNQGRTDHL